MGPPDPASDAAQPVPQTAAYLLQILGQDLEALHRQVTTDWAADIAQLHNRKQQLMADIEVLEKDCEALRSQLQQLQGSCGEALTQQQLAQQQLWAKRLAVALATHLQGRLEAALATHSPAPKGTDAEGTVSLHAASQGLAALDATLQTTLTSIQRDLASYRSSLSQQISRMQNVEQQGEALLEALVARLSQQLQSQMTQATEQPTPGATPWPYRNGTAASGIVSLPHPAATAANGGGSAPGPALPLGAYRSPVHPRPRERPVPPPAPPSQTVVQGSPELGDRPAPAAPAASPAPLAQSQVGIAVIVLSTLALSLHNVVVGVIGYGGQILGRVPVAPILPLTIPNSLLLLWLRMAVVVPLLLLLAPRLHPTVGRDLRQLLSPEYRRPLVQVMASGAFLFMSQVLIYKAIADVGPGVAVTLLFMYPLITVPLAWFLFGDRPTPLRLVVMFAISMGIVFTALPRIYTDLSGNGVSLWGVGSALLASVAFALFLIAMQLCFRQLHPVSASLFQFCTIFVLTSAILIVGAIFGLSPGVPSSSLGLYTAAGLLGLLTLMGYLLNNYGVKLLGAAQASIVAASGPVVTAILAYLLTPGEKSALLFIQWMGVILVTLGVISLSLERLTNQRHETRRRAAVAANTGQWP